MLWWKKRFFNVAFSPPFPLMYFTFNNWKSPCIRFCLLHLIFCSFGCVFVFVFINPHSSRDIWWENSCQVPCRQCHQGRECQSHVRACLLLFMWSMICALVRNSVQCWKEKFCLGKHFLCISSAISWSRGCDSGFGGDGGDSGFSASFKLTEGKLRSMTGKQQHQFSVAVTKRWKFLI